MKSFARSHIPLLAVILILAAGAALAYGGYVDPTTLAAAPLLLPIGNLSTDVPVAKLLRAVQGKRDETIKALTALTAAVPEGGSLTAEQQKAYDGYLATMKGLDADVDRFKALIEAQRSSVEVGKILGTKPNVEDDPKRGFKHFGEFTRAVFAASPVGGQSVDERLLIGAATPGATFSNENVGTDGGFLVPTEFSKEITKLSLDSDAFLPMTDSMPVSGNSITFPSDETTPWGTNGVRAFWASEAAVATATKPLIKPNTMRLNKLFGLVPVTDELLADSPAIAAYLTGLLGRSIKWKVNDALVNGTGAGQPLGFAKGGALVVVNKEAAQAANTLVAANVAKMYAAMPVDYLQAAVWLIAPDALPQLMTMTIGNFSIWTPPSTGFANAPGGFLFGKPVIPTQTAQALSAQGDIYFTTFQAYRTISKDGVQIASSMHLYFDADSTAFRATFRLDGQPTFKNPIVQARGAQNLSPYITLQNR
jgi:HK97 family phage major capsid protein